MILGDGGVDTYIPDVFIEDEDVNKARGTIAGESIGSARGGLIFASFLVSLMGPFFSTLPAIVSKVCKVCKTYFSDYPIRGSPVQGTFLLSAYI